MFLLLASREVNPACLCLFRRRPLSGGGGATKHSPYLPLTSHLPGSRVISEVGVPHLNQAAVSGQGDPDWGLSTRRGQLGLRFEGRVRFHASGSRAEAGRRSPAPKPSR
jgi:hypothetical protein